MNGHVHISTKNTVLQRGIRTAGRFFCMYESSIELRDGLVKEIEREAIDLETNSKATKSKST